MRPCPSHERHAEERHEKSEAIDRTAGLGQRRQPTEERAAQTNERRVRDGVVCKDGSVGAYQRRGLV